MVDLCRADRLHSDRTNILPSSIGCKAITGRDNATIAVNSRMLIYGEKEDLRIPPSTCQR
ncbi:MAG: hypothetical protein IM586_12475 [Pseudanabaena sp. M172S2SP2A07QC]|nr:hypothetical protein [Pseudanabaena sp. M172S2SP2A07QC]MCA6546701.1 hypothetical protein [Pseudanabaena sp. M152S2SP2A07QC]